MSGHLEDITQRNIRKIHERWGMIKNTLIVRDVIDPLIEAGVVEVDRWVEMKKIRSEKDKAEELLVILTRKPSSIPVFYRALKDKNHSLATDLKILEDSNIPGKEKISWLRFNFNFFVNLSCTAYRVFQAIKCSYSGVWLVRVFSSEKLNFCRFH